MPARCSTAAITASASAASSKAARPARAKARASKFKPDGKVDVYVGSSAIGQGIETIMAQIAADALEIPMDEVRILHGSTNYLKEGFGSYGSRSTVMGGSAIVLAVEDMLKAFRERRRGAFRRRAEDVVRVRRRRARARRPLA